MDFTKEFIDYFIPLYLIKARVDGFLYIKHGNLSVKEYYLQFTHLSKFAPEIVCPQTSPIHSFLNGLAGRLMDVVFITTINMNLDIEIIMAHYP